MSRPITILLVSNDPDLPTEWQAAEAALGSMRVITHFAENRRDAVKVATSRQPDIILLASGETDLGAFAAELRDAAPLAHLVGVLDRRQFESGDEESAFVVAATRAGVRDFVRRPLSSSELIGCFRRLDHGASGNGTSQPARAGRVVCFVSNKGGVGKTTLAVNVACELGRRAPGRVLLVDAALQLGLCATMLNLQPEVTVYDVVSQIDRLDGTLLRELTIPHESGIDLLAAPGDAVEAAAIDEESLSRILGVARLTYDYVIVDTFPMLDGIAIATFDRADEVWQVVAPTVPTVLGAERLLSLLEGVGVEQERQRILVNVSVPPHGGGLSARDVATRLNRQVDLVVPFCRGAVAACNTGRPIVLAERRWGGFRRSIGELATLVAEPAMHLPEVTG